PLVALASIAIDRARSEAYRSPNRMGKCGRRSAARRGNGAHRRWTSAECLRGGGWKGGRRGEDASWTKSTRNRVFAPQTELQLNSRNTQETMTTRSILLRLMPFVLPFAMQSSALADNPHSSSSNKVHPGEFVVEPTTLINAGFEWYVDGDA